MSDLVGDPEGRFSCAVAQINYNMQSNVQYFTIWSSSWCKYKERNGCFIRNCISLFVSARLEITPTSTLSRCATIFQGNVVPGFHSCCISGHVSVSRETQVLTENNNNKKKTTTKNTLIVNIHMTHVYEKWEQESIRRLTALGNRYTKYFLNMQNFALA